MGTDTKTIKAKLGCFYDIVMPEEIRLAVDRNEICKEGEYLVVPGSSESRWVLWDLFQHLDMEPRYFRYLEDLSDLYPHQLEQMTRTYPTLFDLASLPASQRTAIYQNLNTPERFDMRERVLFRKTLELFVKFAEYNNTLTFKDRVWKEKEHIYKYLNTTDDQNITQIVKEYLFPQPITVKLSDWELYFMETSLEYWASKKPDGKLSLLTFH